MTITQAYTPTVIDRLNAEWAVRYADVPHAWPHGEQTGDQLRQSVSEAPREEREQLMRGLLEQAAQGDEHCGRAVLQLMLPRFTLIAARHTRMRLATVHGDSSAQEEVAAAVIAAAWRWVRKPSLHRPGSCIGNLAMDVMKDSLLERRIYDIHDGNDTLPDWLPELATTSGDEQDGDRATLELCALVAWARDTAVFSSRDASVFLRYQLADDQERAALSQECGYNGRALCKRVSVLRSRLTKALKDYALQRSDLTVDWESLMQQGAA